MSTTCTSPDTYTAQKNNVKDFFHTGTSLNNSAGFAAGTDHMYRAISLTPTTMLRVSFLTTI
jgi:hypothetical protein